MPPASANQRMRVLAVNDLGVCLRLLSAPGLMSLARPAVMPATVQRPGTTPNHPTGTVLAHAGRSAARCPSGVGMRSRSLIRHATPNTTALRPLPTAKARRRSLRRVTTTTALLILMILAAACTPEPPAPPDPIPTGATGCALGAPDGAGSYAFSNIVNGCPWRWNPCSTIPWWYNPTAELRPKNEIDAAVATLARATGLTFQYQGTTSVPTDVWTTASTGLLIGWESLPPGLIGLTRNHGTGTEIRSSAVALTTNFNSADPALWQAFMLHELGHSAGLGHVSDPAQVLYPTITTPTNSFAPGDLAGLRYLGVAQGCTP